jgi:hypothetical protein
VLEQSRLETLDQDARIAQAGQFNHSTIAELQTGAGRKFEQIDIACGDVLSKVAWAHNMTLIAQRVEKLCLDQMDLLKVWLLTKTFDVVTVLIGCARVCVPFDAEIFDEPDRVLRCLAKDMPGADMNSNDCGYKVRVGHC